MYLGRVIGSVVAARKAAGLDGQRMLMVQPLDPDGSEVGGWQAAVDTVRAGPGDLVYLVGSREAAEALEDSFAPVDAAIVGIVDQLDPPGASIREDSAS